MAVKLYNRTLLSDDLIRSLLVGAQRLAGATGNVIVKVGRTERGTHGMACSCHAHKINGRWVKTAGGYFEIWAVITNHPAYDVLRSAEQFFWVAVHEFAHIRDYQADPLKSKMKWSHRNRRRGWNLTRMNHDSRPEEIRADNAVYEAKELLKRQRTRRGRIEEQIIMLGIALESLRATSSRGEPQQHDVKTVKPEPEK